MLLEEIALAIPMAMKAKDSVSLTTLRSMKASIELKANETGTALTKPQEIQVLQTCLKQRKDAAAQYRLGNREDLALNEHAEAAIIRRWLPELLSGDKLARVVTAGINLLREECLPVNMGSVIKHVTGTATKYNKIVDGKELSLVVKSSLG